MSEFKNAKTLDAKSKIITRLNDLVQKVDPGSVEWKINKDSAELEINTLLNLLNKKTKLLAVTHCSNIVGSVNNIKQITKLAHSNGTLVMADGVSYAPHGFPDVKDLGVDFYTFSLYRSFIYLLYQEK